MHPRCPVIQYLDGGTCPWPATERLPQQLGGMLVCRSHAPRPRWRLPLQIIALMTLAVSVCVGLTLCVGIHLSP